MLRLRQSASSYKQNPYYQHLCLLCYSSNPTYKSFFNTNILFQKLLSKQFCELEIFVLNVLDVRVLLIKCWHQTRRGHPGRQMPGAADQLAHLKTKLQNTKSSREYQHKFKLFCFVKFDYLMMRPVWEVVVRGLFVLAQPVL